MNNIVNFKKPEKPNQPTKPNPPIFMKVIFVVIIMLVVSKIPQLIGGSTYLFMRHDVNMFSNPIKIPEDYQVLDLSGKNQKLSEMLGNDITILAFWATWCGYCAKEMPVMDKVIPYLSEHGVKIIPISRGDDAPDKIHQFFERGHIKNVESVIATTNELHAMLGVQGYPGYVAVDKNGMAFAKLRPRWGSEDINQLFEELQKKVN